MNKLKLMVNGKYVMSSKCCRIVLDVTDASSDQYLILEPGDILTVEVEKEKLSADEKAILRSINSRYEWIARDEDNNLYCYSAKPSKRNGDWIVVDIHKDLNCFNHIFKSIKWSDNEPQEIAKLLEN